MTGFSWRWKRHARRPKRLEAYKKAEEKADEKDAYKKMLLEKATTSKKVEQHRMLRLKKDETTGHHVEKGTEKKEHEKLQKRKHIAVSEEESEEIEMIKFEKKESLRERLEKRARTKTDPVDNQETDLDMGEEEKGNDAASLHEQDAESDAASEQKSKEEEDKARFGQRATQKIRNFIGTF